MFNLTLTTSSSLSFLELELVLLLISIRLLNAFLEALPPFLAGGSTSIFAWRRALLAARADTRRAEDPSEIDGDGGLVSPSCEKVTLVFFLGLSPSLPFESSELFRIYVYNEERWEWVKYWYMQSGKAFLGFSIPGHQKMMGSAVQLRNWNFVKEKDWIKYSTSHIAILYRNRYGWLWSLCTVSFFQESQWQVAFRKEKQTSRKRNLHLCL